MDCRYTLIDATPTPGTQMVDRTDTYSSLAEANKHVTKRGPPLPIVIQHSVHQEAELKDFIALVKSVPNGGSNAHAEEFVKAVIKKIEHLDLWEENGTMFYVLLNGIRANKYIAQGWKNISDVVVPASGGRKEITPKFPTFIHAFVYGLAGGKGPLVEYGLSDRWGWVPHNSTPSKGNNSGKAQAIESGDTNVPVQSTPSFQGLAGRPQVSFSGLSTSSHRRSELLVPAPPAPTSQSTTATLLPSAQHRRTGSPVSESSPESDWSADIRPIGGGLTRREKAQMQIRRTPPGILPIRGKSTTTASTLTAKPNAPVPPSSHQVHVPPPPIPSKTMPPASKGEEVATSEESTVPPLCNPTTLIPLSAHRKPEFSIDPLPLVTRRSPTSSRRNTTIYSTEITSRTDLFLLAETSLPPFVEFALRAIGWHGGVLDVVEAAWLSGETVDQFIFKLGRAGVPMAEAYLTWKLLNREAANDLGEPDRD